MPVPRLPGLPRDCAHRPAHRLPLTPLPQAGWAGSASEAAKSGCFWERRAEQAGSQGRQAAPRPRSRQSLGLPGAEVELTLLSAGDGLSPTLASQKSALVGKRSLPSLLAEAHQHNSLDGTNQALVCGRKWVYPSPCPPEELVRAKQAQQAAKPPRAREGQGAGTNMQTPREQRLETPQAAKREEALQHG